MLTPDLCVIGAGAAGLSVAAGAAQMGARVVLIEASAMGGDCLNAGCVPSKALLAAAHHAQARRRGGDMGIAACEPQVDFAAVNEHIRRVIAAIAPHDSRERFEGLGVTVLQGQARFADSRTLALGPTLIRPRRIVIATGAQPHIPPIPGLAATPYLTNHNLFDLRQLPDHLLILGGGAIGVEMAQAHRRLGARVTLIEAERCLPREDAEAADLLLRQLQDEGVQILQGRQVRGVEGAEGAITLSLSDGSTLTGSHLLIATGRRPALAGLDLQAGGVALDPQGRIALRPDLRSVSNRRVYVAGDAAGGAQFTHLAGAQAASILRSTLFALPARAPLAAPSVIYTDPELGQIGLTESAARQAYAQGIEVIRIPFDQIDRARCEAAATGFVKLVLRRGRAVGVTLIGPGAGELIAPWALAMERRLPLSAMAGLILPYPTRGEIAKRAAGAYFSPRLFASPWVKRVLRAVQWVIR